MALPAEDNGANQADDRVYNLREWAPLTDLIEKIPLKVQNGLFPQHVKLTCVDILEDHIVLGTNLGTVYWYNRTSKDLDRLRCENTNVKITVVKVISTVDYMVAAGGNDGNISIFQIPKAPPDGIPESLRPKVKKKVERYTVSELHKSPISAIEWSKNGMKLFSGDKTGCVVYTELDFYMHICKSVEILNETYEVVQLSYNQQKLLVSTTYRSIICHKTSKWKVCQVGKKDRKLLGSFGGLIHQNGLRTTDCVLYCTRPGLRMWIADIEGGVQKTLLFKDLLSKECSEVPIINPMSRSLQALKPQKEPNFGVLLPFHGDLLVTYNNDVVYVLNPEKMCVLYKISHLRSVLSIAAHKDEIFILEEDRSLIRISHRPEVPLDSAPSTVSSSNSSSPIDPVKALSARLHPTNIMSALPPFLEYAFGADINSAPQGNVPPLETHAEEAKESPPVKNLKCDNRSFDSIGKQTFNDNILFKKSSKPRRGGKRDPMSASTNSLSSTSSSEEKEKEPNYIKPTIMTLSAVGVLPDLRSPESIKNDIEYKEKLLADILNLDTIKIPLEAMQCSNDEADDRRQPPVSKSSESNRKAEDYRAYVMDYRGGGASVERQPGGGRSREVVEQRRGLDEVKTSNTDCDPRKVSPIDGQPHSNTHDIPDCLRIPNDWKLSDIHLNAKHDSLSDNSLNDWELV